MFTQPAEAAADTPRGQLEAFFAQLEVMVRLPQFRGCPFANASAELADFDHPAHQVVRRHKNASAAGCSGAPARPALTIPSSCRDS